VQSGDLGAGDVLVTAPDDPRLVMGLAENDTVEAQDELDPQEWELGIGRRRMLSPEGRREAAHRWYREAGPRSAVARSAEMPCATCGFLLLIGGPLGQAFGVCANGFSPVDGRIVAMDFGCGAHSETVQLPTVPVADIVVDEVGYDQIIDDSDAQDETQPEPESDVDEEALASAPPDGAELAAHETMDESDPEEGS
jgi:hypothetical protein